MKTRKLMSLLVVASMVVSLAATGITGYAEESSDSSDLEEITITLMISEPATQEVPDTAPVLDAIKEKFNINVDTQIIPSSDYDTKVSTILASNSMPDVLCNVTIDEVRRYGMMGMFLDIDDYAEYAEDYFALINGEDRVEETDKIRIDGDMYAFQTLEKYRIAIAPIIGIRMDLLDELGIATPTTYDEYYDALLTIKEAYPDMYGFSTRGGTNYLVGSFAYGLGSGGFYSTNTERGIYYEPDSDSYIYAPTDEKFVPVIEFLRNAYADGLLDPDYATMDKDTLHQKLSNGTLMSEYDNNSFIARTFNPALREIDENAYFDVLEPLENEYGQTRDYRYSKDWSTDNFVVVSSQTEYPERIVEMLNWLYTDEGWLVSNFGIEGVHYDMVDGEPVYKQELIDEYAGADDQASAVLGSIGAGLLGYGLYVDESVYKQVSDPIYLEEAEKIDEWTEEGEITFYPNFPSLTEDEQERVTELESDLANVFDQEIDAFITGKKSMDEWDDVVETLKSQGSEELEEIFNTAYDRIK